MSRPRKPYGPNPPGRLQATMVKVLAAELSDAGRLSRGKRYWHDDAVIDIVIGHGAVTAEVQGGRPDPYVVTIEAEAGTGVPSKRELWIRCTCPDDGGIGACKHAVAALFALSDEIAIEPEVVGRWRASRRRGDGVAVLPEPVDAAASEERDRLADVVPLRRSRPLDEQVPPEPDPTVDEIGRLLGSPDGASLPDLPDPGPLDHPALSDRLVDRVLSDALDQLAIRWD